MGSSLAFLSQENIDQVCVREETALDALLDSRQRRVVLFGAGTLGKRARTLLNEIGVTPLAFTDNSTKAWGMHVEGITVLSPQEAASLYGASALFLVTIWNDRHWFRETYEQLTKLGCTLISSYAPLFWRFPDSFLQLVLLNALPRYVYQQASEVFRAEEIWADQQSRETYTANIRWRALGDPLDLPGRPEENTYFPVDLFCLQKGDSLLDCGAFDGDTLRQALAIGRNTIGHIHAVEADSISFAHLQEFVEQLPKDERARIRLYPWAVGLQRGEIFFENCGTVDSKISDHGTKVDVYPIDELFHDTSLTFIKMDIEGAEFDALRGGAKVILRDRPILAICVYHTQNDIWRIPLLVSEMLPDHKLFLRAYEGDGFQTVLYAVPPQRVPESPSQPNIDHMTGAFSS